MMDFEAPISEVMDTKVVSVNDTSSVFDACRVMAEKNVGTLVLVRDGLPSSVLSEKDVIVNVLLQRKDPASIAVRDIAPKEFISEQSDNTILDASLKMNEHNLKRIPIVDESGKLVGILSSSDIVHLLAEFTLFQNFSKE